MSDYLIPEQSDIEFFKSIVGDSAVLTDIDDKAPYCKDETEDFHFEPHCVVKPSDANQISAIMAHCNKRKIAVTPRGGGTGLSGGALCVHGGVCLSLEKMNRVIEIDTKNLIAVVEPGVIVEELHNAAAEHGLMYPPDPASKGSCTIGGNIAECAGGPRAVKYGVTRDYVLGVKAVLPTGESISTGGKLLKNVTGYGLTQLITGSEGTLAIVVEATLKLIPLPLYKVSLLVPFETSGAAVKALNMIFMNKITPAAAEFMERVAVETAEKMLGKKFPCAGAGAMLLLELDGNDKDALARECEKAGETLLENGARDVLVAETALKQKELWDLRRSIGEAVKKISAYKEEDTVVPRAVLPELIESLKRISTAHGFTTICYGHAGDGNVHANIIRGDMDEKKWREDLPDAIADVHRAVVELGGSISGEHGIGFSQKKYLPIAIGSVEIELMKKIKSIFDPAGILNPGKIFP